MTMQDNGVCTLMNEERTNVAFFVSDKGTRGVVIADKRTDGRWGFSWWCPLGKDGNVGWAHGDGIAGDAETARSEAVSAASAEGR